MVVGQVAEVADVVVVGAGPGGYAAALHAARRGRQVTLVERDAVGGTCLNVGCIPSKALIEVADLVGRRAEAATWGVALHCDVDMVAVQAHLRRTVEALTGGVRGLLQRSGVRVLSGTARFATRARLVVDAGDHVSHLEFADLVLATGSRPAVLGALPVDGRRVLDSTAALALDHVPASVAVVGGGYIGVELGTALAKLGSRVSIVEAADRLLPGLDAALGRVVARRLGDLGVDVRLGATAAGLTDDGLVVSPAAAADTAVPAEVVVVAVGRVPNSDGLGLDVAGVKVDERGLVAVDPARRTTAPHVWAVGDLTAGPALAHKATAEAEVVARGLGGEAAAFDPAVIPQVVFGDPEVVSVGVTADALRLAGEACTSFRFPFSASGRARTLSRPLGHAEVVADAEGTVVGVHLVGPHVSELAGEAALAVELAATLDDVAATIHPHPTLSEVIAEAAQGALGHPLHIAAQHGREGTPR